MDSTNVVRFPLRKRVAVRLRLGTGTALEDMDLEIKQVERAIKTLMAARTELLRTYRGMLSDREPEPVTAPPL